MMTFNVQVELKRLDAFASSLASQVTSDLCIGLIGELGAGKTTFVRAFVRALDINDQVTSPSYSLENEYEHLTSPILVRHVDLYRGISRLEQEQLFEKRDPRKVEILLIEWSNLLEFKPPIPYLELIFTILPAGDDEVRKIKISGLPAILTPLKEQLAKKLG